MQTSAIVAEDGQKLPKLPIVSEILSEVAMCLGRFPDRILKPVGLPPAEPLPKLIAEHCQQPPITAILAET